MFAGFRRLALAATFLLTFAAAPAALASQPAVDLWEIGSSGGKWVGLVDARTVRRSGDIVTLDFVMVYRDAGETGEDYLLAHHRIDCAARTYAGMGFTTHRLNGERVNTGAPSAAPMAIPAASVVAQELNFVCNGDHTSAVHWEGVTVSQVANVLRLYWKQDEAEGAKLFDYWLIAGEPGSYFVIDVASIRREGDEAWVKIIGVRQTTGADGFDYLVAEDHFDCAARLSKPVAVGGYRANGDFLGDFKIAHDGVTPIGDEALDKLEFAYACQGERGTGLHLGNYPAGSVVQSVRENWSSL